MRDLALACHECNRTVVLDARQQNEILAELTRPAHMKIVECACGKFQFVLSARRTTAGKA
jgi:hypothetical protein